MFAVVLGVQSRAAFGQASARKIEFAKLSDYVDDFSSRRDGERLVVTGVPSFDNMKFRKRYNMYLLEGELAATGVGDTFYTSPALAKLLLTHLGTLTESFRITCTLIQFVSSQDVYRSPFATKIEGIDDNGKVVWAISGPPPTRLRRPE
jgi:hypothetical protein